MRSGKAFVGQTEFLSALAGTKRTIMMLLGPDERERWLRVALATTHLPLKRELRDEKEGFRVIETYSEFKLGQKGGGKSSAPPK